MTFITKQGEVNKDSEASHNSALKTPFERCAPRAVFQEIRTANLLRRSRHLRASTCGSLAVSSLATLDGRLALNLTGGFTLAVGEVFDLMSFAGVGGDFKHLSLDGSACSEHSTDVWSCSNLSGLYIEEVFGTGFLNFDVVSDPASAASPINLVMPGDPASTNRPTGLVDRAVGLYARSRPWGEAVQLNKLRYSIAAIVWRANRARVLICFFMASPSAVNSPCLTAFLLPRGAPPWCPT